MAFAGWPVEAVEFFEGLGADNSKAYWTAHREVYETAVRAPLAELLAELADEFGAGHIARPYRDVRFSRDKAPYKTAVYATLDGGGYVRFSAAGLTVGSGYYLMAADQLDRYRRAVADDRSGAALVGIVRDLAAAQIQVAGADTLRGAPRGYPKDHPRIELLRHKGLIAWRDWAAQDWLGTAAARQVVVDFLRTAAPLRAWLDGWVGPSTLPPARRR